MTLSMHTRWQWPRAPLRRVGLLLGLLAACWALLPNAYWAQTESGAIAGIVVDEVAAPLAGVKVTLSSQIFSASTLTESDGRFEFRQLAPGEYRITIEAPGFRKESLPAVIARPGDLVSPMIRLRVTSLHVSVLDTVSRQPLSRVVITLAVREASGPTAPAAAVAARAITDDGGDAYFGRLGPGSYQLTATLRGYDEYRSEVFIAPGRVTTEFTLPLSIAPVIPINDKALVRYNVPNLPSKNVQAIFQDSAGWLWFGTDKGVARFNGSSFRSSQASDSWYSSLANVDVRSIAEDRSGLIWLATTDGARKITVDGQESARFLQGSEVRDVMLGPGGEIWLATNRGTFLFDGRDLRQVDSNDALDTKLLKDGRVWIATRRGILVHDSTGLSRFDPAGKEPLEQVEGLFVDRSGSVWLRGRNDVRVFDGASLAPAADPIALEPDVRAIGQDRAGRLWFALESGGALVYDTARRESQRLSSLHRDKVAVIETDREGNTWFGTDNGAVRADLYGFINFDTSRGLADNDVRAVVETPAPNRQLWFATAAGISRLEGERLMPVEGFRSGISVRGIAFDRSGGAWLATEQGVLRLHAQTLTQLNEANGLASNTVRSVAAVGGGDTLVFATAKGASLFKDESLRNLEELAGYDVRHVFENEDGRLWFSTARGIVVYEPETGATSLIDSARGLADNDVRWITRFGDRLIVATHAGLQACHHRRALAGQQELFTTVDSEPATTLFVDRDGYLWAGNENGQIKKFAYFGANPVSTTYSSETNALTAKRINSISEDGDGGIWIATNSGAVRHIPVRTAPPTQIWLEVEGRALRKETATLGKGDKNGSEVYDLPYGRHRLMLRFAGVSMSGQVRFLYRVREADEDEAWTALAVQQGAEREVPLFDVGEGAHTFEVITLNRDLYGAGQPGARGPATATAALSLRIGPPFWKSGWFYVIAIALAMAAAAAVVLVRRLRNREYVLPKSLRIFVPIDPNPFIVGNPIRTETMFYGREDDFRYVRTKLEGANQGVVIVFCGERRVGKSSILYQVMNGRLGERFIPVFVDMQEMVVTSDAEFFTRVSRLITESIGSPFPEPSRALSGMERGAALAGSSTTPIFYGGNPYTVFLDFLDGALKSIGDRTLLILIDEYELIESKVDEGKLSPELFTFLAGLMDNKERLALIFTGSRRLEERDRKYWRELLRRSLFRKVGFLSQNDTVRLITEPVAGRVIYGRGVVDGVCRLTAGQPFYTQVICQNAVDYLNEHKQNWFVAGDLSRVVAEILDNPPPHMIYAWDGLSDDEKLVFSLLAEVLPDGSAYTTAGDLRVAVSLNRYPVNLSENTIRVTLEEMFRREMVDKGLADGFRFKMDLFRLWVRRAHSIWQVINEVRTH